MAYTFDETDDYLSLADNAALTFPVGDWAIALWVKWADTTGTGTQFLLSTDLNGATPTLTLRLNEASAAANANCVLFTFRDDAGNAGTGTSSNTPGASTAWQHLLLQRSGNFIDLYSNGTSVATSGFTWSVTNNSANPLRIAARSDLNAASFFGGDMAEVAKWDRALTATEISRLASGWLPTRFATPAWYLPLNGDTLEKIVGITVTVGDAPAQSTHPTIQSAPRMTRNLMLGGSRV